MEQGSINFVRINGPSGGSAMPIVMLHGWGQSLEALRSLGELLSSTHPVLLIDLPGFGRSPLPAEASNEGGGWDTKQYAEVIKTFLATLGISKCILLGHSFGGRVSVRLMNAYPDFAAAAVLMASHGIPAQRSAAAKFRSSYLRFLANSAKTIDRVFGTDLFKEKFAPRFGSRDYREAGDLRKTLVKTVNENLSSAAAAIATPALLLWGDKDRETPPGIGQSYNRLMKNSKFVLLKGKDHELFKDVGSHLLAAHIEKFLAAQPGAAA